MTQVEVTINIVITQAISHLQTKHTNTVIEGKQNKKNTKQSMDQYRYIVKYGILPSPMCNARGSGWYSFAM
jgi:hypothetical protein